MGKTGVVGGGASGLMAAICAAQHGAEVTVLEGRDRIGKKILATGNGKCNFSNRDFLIPRDYRGHHTDLLPRYFSRFCVEDTVLFFREKGMLATDRDGYLYPRCGQASVVLDLLEGELSSLGVKTVCSCPAERILPPKGGRKQFLVETRQGTFSFDRLILACGSPAGYRTQEGEDGQKLARDLGLSSYEMFPALVGLRCRENWYKRLAGVRCHAGISLRIWDKAQKPAVSEKGELQLTDYGISGIPVFQLSRYASVALGEGKSVFADIDFLPEIPLQDWPSFCLEQYRLCENRTALQLGNGLVHKKIAQVLLAQCSLKDTDPVDRRTKKKVFSFFDSLRRFETQVVSPNPVQNAQVCAGGVSLRDVTDNLESRKIPGLFLCGEMLDVDGRCGGYNLQWAWTSGFIAGTCAAQT